MKDSDRYVPCSGRRFSVNCFGDLFDNKGVVLEPFMGDEGRLYHDIEWVLGGLKYEIALIMLVSFNKLKIGKHLWRKITFDYKDGNIKNTVLNNLSYHFTDGPLEVEELPGFYYLPFYTRYAIKRDGTLININQGNIKSWSRTNACEKRNSTGGYRYTRVLSDSGQTKILYRHRALGLVFLNYGNDPSALVVNHIDGKPENDDLDNLEWVTYSENNSHAYKTGLRPNSSKPVLVKNRKNGIEERFESITECAKRYDFSSRSSLERRIKKGVDKAYTDNLIFKYDDGKPWPIIKTDHIYSRKGNGAVVAKNIFTNTLYVFNDLKECGEFIEINNSYSHLFNHVNNEAFVPINGYVCRYLKDNIEWPKYTHRHLLTFKKYPSKSPKGVILKNRETGEEQYFESSIEAAQAMGIDRSDVYRHINHEIAYKGNVVLSFNTKKQH
jgi:hypothetical protein